MSKEEQVEKLMTKCVELQAKLDKPITEHPDVKRLIGQVVVLQAENELFKEEARKQWLVSEKYREALEKLARLGNGKEYGNSDGNVIAQQALKGE